MRACVAADWHSHSAALRKRSAGSVVLFSAPFFLLYPGVAASLLPVIGSLHDLLRQAAFIGGMQAV